MIMKKLLLNIGLVLAMGLAAGVASPGARASDHTDHDLVILRELSFFHFQAEEYDQSIAKANEYLTDSSVDSSHDPEVLNLRGLSYYKLQNYLEAEKDLALAIEKTSEPGLRSFYRVNLAEVYKSSGRVKESLEQIRLALWDSPEDPDLQRLVGGVTGGGLYAKLKSSEQAESRTELVLQIAEKYDSNVLLKPTGDLAASAISSRGGLVMPVFGMVKFTTSALSKQDFSLGTHLAYNYNHNRDLKNFDTLDVGLNMAEVFTERGALRITLADGVHYFMVNSAGMAGLLFENRLAPAFEVDLKQNRRLVFKVPLSYGNFVEDARDTKNQKTYFKSEFGAEYHFFALKSFPGFIGGAFVLNESKGVNYQQVGGKALGRIGYQFGDDAFNPFVSAEYRYFKYPKREPVRADKTAAFTVGVTKDLKALLGSKFFAQGDFSFERNSSNDTSVEYSKTVTSLSLGFRL